MISISRLLSMATIVVHIHNYVYVVVFIECIKIILPLLVVKYAGEFLSSEVQENHEGMMFL